MTSRKHRIVHIVSGDQWAGAEVMQAHLLTHLAAHAPQWDLTTICLNEGELAARLRAGGVDVIMLREASLSFAQIFLSARRALAARPPDVLHSHRYKEHTLSALLAPWFGARTVSTIHGLPEPARVRRMRYEMQSALTVRLLRSRFDRNVAVSEDLRRQLIALHGFPESAVDVVINGIPIPEEPAPLRSPATVHIGSVGRFVKVKRFELFLETAALLIARNPNVQFSILGDGPDRDLLVAKAASLGIADRVRFMPPVSDPTSFFESLDVYVNTSEHEGLPLSVLEAMAHGVPVVAAAVGGVPEIVTTGVNGLLVATAEAADFAAAVASLLDDRVRRADIGQRGRDRVIQEFSATTMAHRYARLYEQVLGAAPANALAPVAARRWK